MLIADPETQVHTDIRETITGPGPRGGLTAEEVLHILDKFPKLLVGLLHLAPRSISLVQGCLCPLVCLLCLPASLRHSAKDATTFYQCPLQLGLCEPSPAQSQICCGCCPTATKATATGLPILIPTSGTPTGAASTGLVPWCPTHLPGTKQIKVLWEEYPPTAAYPTPRLHLTSSFMPVRLRVWVREESCPSAFWFANCLRLKFSFWAPMSTSVRRRVSAELLTGLGTARVEVLARRSASVDWLWACRMLS